MSEAVSKRVAERVAERVVKRVVVGVSGGSGLRYALDLLKTLQTLPVETHLVITSGAKQVIPTELDETVAGLEALADVTYKDADLGAAISSGSFRAHGMVIVPCSAGTLAKVAHGFADNLLSRAAHVTLKERRPLVLVVREAPFSRPMLQNMLAALRCRGRHHARVAGVLSPTGDGRRTHWDGYGAYARFVGARRISRSPRWKE